MGISPNLGINLGMYDRVLKVPMRKGFDEVRDKAGTNRVIVLKM